VDRTSPYARTVVHRSKHKLRATIRRNFRHCGGSSAGRTLLLEFDLWEYSLPGQNIHCGRRHSGSNINSSVTPPSEYCPAAPYGRSKRDVFCSLFVSSKYQHWSPEHFRFAVSFCARKNARVAPTRQMSALHVKGSSARQRFAHLISEASTEVYAGTVALMPLPRITAARRTDQRLLNVLPIGDLNHDSLVCFGRPTAWARYVVSFPSSRSDRAGRSIL